MYPCLLSANVPQDILCLKIYFWCIHGERCTSYPHNPPPSGISRQKVKRNQVLNYTLNQMDLTDTFKSFHAKTVEYTLFLMYTWNIVQNRWHVGSKIKHQLIQESWNHIKYLFWLQHYETCYQLQEGKNFKKHKHMEAEQHTSKKPKSHWRNKKGYQRIPRNKCQWKYSNPKPMEWIKNSYEREVYKNTVLPQETTTINIK